MSVTRAEVETMARLARLRMEESEADRLADEMTRILGFADQLRAAGGERRSTLDGAHRTSVRQPQREAPGVPDPLERRPADFAPRFADGFFLVPPPPGVTAENGPETTLPGGREVDVPDAPGSRMGDVTGA